MAKLATAKTSSPRKACKALDKKHEEGEKDSPFSRCVSDGAKLLRDQKAQDEDGEHQTNLPLGSRQDAFRAKGSAAY
jgi:hypothetical protein